MLIRFVANHRSINYFLEFCYLFCFTHLHTELVFLLLFAKIYQHRYKLVIMSDKVVSKKNNKIKKRWKAMASYNRRVSFWKYLVQCSSEPTTFGMEVKYSTPDVQSGLEYFFCILIRCNTSDRNQHQSIVQRRGDRGAKHVHLVQLSFTSIISVGSFLKMLITN